MKILVINTGSSSIKYSLFSMEDNTVLANGIIEKIGEDDSVLTHRSKNQGDEKTVIKGRIPDHKAGMEKLVMVLTDPENGVIKNTDEVDAVGHRVVHGAESFKSTTIINDEVLKSLKENIPLAPLHNPANVTGIETAQKIFSSSLQVGVFDTAFHHTIPPKAYLYALPYEMYEELKIRRYGFHGTSHKYVAETAAAHLGRPLEELNLITIHLGNGGSITAIKNGKSVDTSMGMTPLEGLVMGTRSGDIDPAIPYYIHRNASKSIEEIDAILNKKSGLKGICGMNDMRDILAACDNGDEKAKVAVEMYAYRIKKYIGAYLAVLGGLDAIVFTAGIGENSPEIRGMVCEEMEHLGLVLDAEKNKIRAEGVQELQKEGGKTKILLIPTDEELKIAMEASELLG